MSSLGINSVSLSSVSVDVGENEVDDIESDGSSENSWESNGGGSLIGLLEIPDGDGRSSGHFTLL